MGLDCFKNTRYEKVFAGKVKKNMSDRQIRELGTEFLVGKYNELGKKNAEVRTKLGKKTKHEDITYEPNMESEIGQTVYEDETSGYHVERTGINSYTVYSKVKTNKGVKETLLYRGDTLQESQDWINQQNETRAKLDEQGADTKMFKVTEEKSGFTMSKLVNSFAVGYVDEVIFGRQVRKVEDAFSKTVGEILRGEKFVPSDANFTLKKMFTGKISASDLNKHGVNLAARFANLFYRGAPRTNKEMATARRLEGLQYKVLSQGRETAGYLSKVIDNDLDAAKRIHQVMDPEIYPDSELAYKDLTNEEKEVHDALRVINQATHEMNYKNGFITKETFDKYDGKYIGRGYEIYEGLEDDIVNQVMADNVIFRKIYDKRKEMESWMVDNTVSDPIYLTLNRSLRSQRNGIVKNYAEYIDKKYSRKERPDHGSWVKMNGKGYGKLEGKWLPTYLAEDFRGYFFSSKFFQGVYDILNVYNRTAYKQFMKRYHTVYSPLVQLGNLSSNHAFAWAAGVGLHQLYKNIPSAIREVRQGVGEDYNTLLEEGIIGANILDKDLRIKSDYAKSLSAKSKSRWKKMDNWARKRYQESDDLMKLSAYKALMQNGYTKDESVQRVFEGFQNYAAVGKIWDVASKTPVIGSDYIKFQADLMRIIKNSALKRPLSTLTFLGTLRATSIALSALSGESEEERKVREERPFIPKIPSPAGSIPLVFRLPEIDKEINVARYMSPFYKYDRGSEHWLETATEFMPFQVAVNEETGEKRILPSDVALGSFWAALVDNKDFRDKLISDPNYNMFTGSLLTPKEKLVNRWTYIIRSQLPMGAFFHDMYLTAKYGEDYYGRDKSPWDKVISSAIKIQTWDSITTRDQFVKDLERLKYADRKLSTRITAIKNRYDKEYIELEVKLSEGTLTQDRFRRKIESITEEFEEREAEFALQELKIQQEFDEWEEKVAHTGYSLEQLLELAE